MHNMRALLKTAVPEFKSSALLGQNSRDIFFSPNGGRTGTAVLSSATFSWVCSITKGFYGAETLS